MKKNQGKDELKEKRAKKEPSPNYQGQKKNRPQFAQITQGGKGNV